MGVKKIIAVFDYVDFAIAWFHMFIMNITHQDVCIDSCLCDNSRSENWIVASNTVLYIYIYIYIHPTFVLKAYFMLVFSQYIIALFIVTVFIMSHCLTDIRDVTPRTVLNLPILQWDYLVNISPILTEWFKASLLSCHNTNYS